MEEEILPAVRELGIGFVAYSPLGRGFLSGRFQSPDDFEEGDFRRNNPRFQGENFTRNLELVGRVKEIADEKDVTAGQLAIAWVMAQGDDVVPIPGTKRVSYLEENLGAAEIEVTSDDLRRLDEAAPIGVAAGTRYPEGQMETVGALAEREDSEVRDPSEVDTGWHGAPCYGRAPLARGGD